MKAGQSVATRFMKNFDLLVSLRQIFHPIQRGHGIVRRRGRGRNRGLSLELGGMIFIVVLPGLVMRVINTIPAVISILTIHRPA